MAEAGFANSLGVYEVSASGAIGDIRMLAGDVSAVEGTTIVVDGVDAGASLGFFLIQDGAEFASSLAEGDTLEFVDASGAAATANAGALTLLVNGIDAETVAFHSFLTVFNPNGSQQVLSGVNPAGEGMTIGFEDTVGGDQDYQDAVFSITIL